MKMFRWFRRNRLSRMTVDEAMALADSGRMTIAEWERVIVLANNVQAMAGQDS